MAEHKVTVSVVGGKVVCEPNQITVKRGHTISFGPIAHKGAFRGRLKQRAMAAAQGASFHERHLKDENLELGAAPSHLPHWTHEHAVTIQSNAEFGAYAYMVTVETPEGPINSDPVVIVEP